VLGLFNLIKKTKLRTLLPVINSNNLMNFTEWKQLDPLQVNEFGMLEPSLQGKIIVPNFMLVPLLAFDSNNNRLGYGKGFYDKFLNKFLEIKKNITTIGVAFSFQKYNKLPVSNLDIKLDYILTEKGLKK
jgi:5-formyltetrahydrofolate cyclo-ligase